MHIGPTKSMIPMFKLRLLRLTSLLILVILYVLNGNLVITSY